MKEYLEKLILAKIAANIPDNFGCYFHGIRLVIILAATVAVAALAALAAVAAAVAVAALAAIVTLGPAVRLLFISGGCPSIRRNTFYFSV